MAVTIHRGAPATVGIQLVDQNGSPRAALGAVTVSCTRSDGSSVFTDQAAVSDPNGLISTTLSPSQTSELDQLSLQWAETNGATHQSVVDIAGGYLFSIAEARQSSSKLRDTTRYSDDEILAGRRAVTEECERITGRAFVPRFRQTRLSGRFGNVLTLPDPDVRQLRRVSIDGQPLIGDPFADVILASSGSLRLGGGTLFNYGESNVEVAYEYGLDAPPERIKDAALLRLQSLIALKKAGVPERAEYQIIEGRVFSLNRLRGGLTGIKEVDDAYLEWRAPGRTTASVPIR